MLCGHGPAEVHASGILPRAGIISLADTGPARPIRICGYRFGAYDGSDSRWRIVRSGMPSFSWYKDIMSH